MANATVAGTRHQVATGSVHAQRSRLRMKTTPSAPAFQMPLLLLALSLLPLTTGADAQTPAPPSAPAMVAPASMAPESTLALTRASGAEGAIVLTITRDHGPDATQAVAPDARVWQSPLPADWRRITCVGEQAVCLPIDRGASSEALVRLTAYPRATLTASWPAAVAGQAVRVMINRQTAAGDSAFGPARGQWQVLARPDGRFSLDVPQGTLDIHLLANGCAVVYRFDVKAGANTALGPLPCVPGGSIAARVRDSQSGNPVASCLATVRPSGPRVATQPDARFNQLVTQSAACNAFGFFQIVGLAPGRYQIVTDSGTHAPDSAEVEIVADAEASVDLWLTAFRTLTVRVSPPVAPDGRAWTVRLRPTEGFSDPTEGWARATVGANGEVQFSRVTPDEHEVEIYTQDEQLVSNVITPLPAAGDPLDITIPLIRVMGSVSMRSQPVAGAVIELSDFHNQHAFTTDHDGRFEGWIRRPTSEQDSLSLSVGSPGAGSTVTQRIVPRYLDDGHMHITLELGSSRVVATVVDDAGNPVEGVIVNLSGMSTASSRSVPPAFSGIRTNASGTAVIEGLIPGRYLAQGYGEGSSSGIVRSAEVNVGSDVEVPVQLALLSRRRHTFDLATSHKSPLAGAYVIIKAASTLAIGLRATDSLGRVNFEVPGDARRASLTVLADSQMLWSGCVPLSEGDRTRITLPPPAAGTLRFARPHLAWGNLLLVNDSGGVMFGDEYERWKRTEITKTDAHDVFEIPGLAAGRYRAVLDQGFLLDTARVVQAACAGAISFDDPSAGTLTPGGVLELKWPAPK